MPYLVLLLASLAASLVWVSATGVADRLLLRAVPAPPPASLAPTPPPASLAPRVHAVEVRRGDTLVRALAREGVDPRMAADLAATLGASGADLRRLSPRAALTVTWNSRGEPIEVRYAPSPWVGFTALVGGGGWGVRRSETQPDIRVEPVQGEVTRSLFQAIEEAGESPGLVVDMVEIFSSDFDFTADTRQGDRFRLLVEKRYAGDRFVDYGRILVAQHVTEAGVLTGVGFERPGARGYEYYDLRGCSLRKSFLKSPLEFTRITSGFTYARPHPILGGVRPHLAIDYAAPIGTPVRAVADGVVTRAGWKGGNGLSVLLRHRAGYETMYNHLSRLGPGVRAGARVRQRQVIGHVGATGLATGPHLDYRVAKNGRFVNPVGERFIPGEPIPPPERARFGEHARVLLERLEREAPL